MGITSKGLFFDIFCGLPRIDHDSMISAFFLFKAKKEAEEVGEGDKSRPPEENFDNKVEFGLLLEVPADHFAVLQWRDQQIQNRSMD